MNLTFRRITLKKRYPLEISRGVITGSENLFVSAHGEDHVGLGELAGTNAPDGESCETGEAELSAFAADGLDGLSITGIWQRARNAGVRPRALAALDMALWDLLAKESSQPLFRLLGLARYSVPTSVTIGINRPDVIRERVPEILTRTGAKFLKIKLGSPLGIDADQENYLAVREVARPFNVGLRVDANGGWDLNGAKQMLKWLADRGTDYVEQPLPSDKDEELPELYRTRPLPVFVDESCWFATDVPRLAGCIDGVNLKLMKCGGITEALRIVATARAHGLQTMIGCMGESTVAISAGAAIGALFDHIDLDSQLNLVNDPARGAELLDGCLVPPLIPGHGAVLSDA